MKLTYRMLRGLLFSLFIFVNVAVIFTINIVYPIFQEKITLFELPFISSIFFYLILLLALLIQFSCWAYRNKLWKGLSYSFIHYKLVKKIRRQLKDDHFENEKEFDNNIVRLPKIMINFDDKQRKTGSILIENSITFDKKFEKIRIDAALDNYIIEAQYLSDDRNYYIYRFTSTDFLKQKVINSEEEFNKWSQSKTNDYQIRLDERVTISIHHGAISGVTGAGKSVLIQSLCYQVITKNIKHLLYIIDPKSADLFQFAKNNLKEEQYSDKENAVELIRNFYQTMLKRQAELQSFFEDNKNKTYEDANLPSLILLIDEFGALHESWKLLSKKERDEIDSMLANIVFMGRQIGCFLWIATQQMNAQTVPTAIRDQLILKIVLGNSDEQTYRTLFSASIKIPKNNFRAGQGIFSYPNIASVDSPLILNVPFFKFLID